MGHSPKAKAVKALKENTMTFPQAIAMVISGYNITKLEWDNPETFGAVREDLLMLHMDGKWHRWIVSYADMVGGDWVVVK